jgi:hypothetical protein
VIRVDYLFTRSTFQYSDRDIQQNLVRASLLRKLKTTRKRWFVLYAASEEHPAHLEYHESEAKWKACEPPRREIILKDCFNIIPERNDNGSTTATTPGGRESSSIGGGNRQEKVDKFGEI